MWSKINIYGKIITNKDLHLKNTLLNGQCFNFKYFHEKDLFAGTVKNNLVLLRDNNSIIEYQYLCKDPNVKCEVEFLQDYFQLDIDLEKDILGGNDLNINKTLKDVLMSYTGLRLIKQEIFECTISFICSANNNIGRITKMIDSLKKKYGKKLYSDSDLGDFYSFPEFTALTKVSVEELNEMGFGYRSKYIRGTMDFLEENGVSWLNDLLSQENPSDELTKLPGVGRKVADCISLFACRRYNVVPIDVHMFKFYNENIAYFTGKNYKKINSVTSKNNYSLLQENLQNVLGSNAGWIHSMFFLSRLSAKKVEVTKTGKRLNSELVEKIELKGNKRGKKSD